MVAPSVALVIVTSREPVVDEPPSGENVGAAQISAGLVDCLTYR